MNLKTVMLSIINQTQRSALYVIPLTYNFRKYKVIHMKEIRSITAWGQGLVESVGEAEGLQRVLQKLWRINVVNILIVVWFSRVYTQQNLQNNISHL